MECFRLMGLFEWLRNGALFANIECEEWTLMFFFIGFFFFFSFLIRNIYCTCDA